MSDGSHPGRVFDLVVVDDNRRFPFHLWHFLSSYTGFGIGDITGREEAGEKAVLSATGHRFWSKDQPVPLETPSGTVRIWWVNVAEEWIKPLEKVLKKSGLLMQGAESPRRFIVDVRGAESTSPDVYSPQKVVRELLSSHATELTRLKEELILVSSYRTAVEPQESDPTDLASHLVRGKSTETFAFIRDQIAGSRPAATSRKRDSEPGRPLHILITGAGAEYSDTTLGEPCALGVPPTVDLVENTLRDARLDPHQTKRGNQRGFDIPATHDDDKALRRAAAERKLDEYWNLLFLKEFERESAQRDGFAACDNEDHLRECFRSRLRHYDWGHLPQTIAAAGLDWHCWLTTNYTRYADRAVARANAAARAGGEPGEPQGEMWEVVATAKEAARLQRRLLHRVEEPNGWRSRYLFKLHGDISHLTTMAIAGYDKEYWSPLSLPIDSLHEVYMASFLYLKQRIERHSAHGGGTVLWHIVGHGLEDQLLLKDLSRLSEGSLDRHHFLVVSNSPWKPALNLKRALRPGSTIRRIKLTAVEYLARLRSGRLLDGRIRSLRQWSRALHP